MRSSEVRLSERQHQILIYLAGGLTSTEMGSRMFLSPHTVRHYRLQVLEALGARNAAHAVHIAHLMGILYH